MLNLYSVCTKVLRVRELQNMFSANRDLSDIALFCTDHGARALSSALTAASLCWYNCIQCLVTLMV